MIQVTFTLRVLTPLFLAGADQTWAELRAPALRGLMRYWYRALAGGVVGANAGTLQQVINAETAVFGATDTGSAISIRVSEPSRDPQRYFREGSKKNLWGKDYLFWSMAANSKRQERLFFPPGTTFQVTLSSKGDDDTKLQQAIAAFWLLTHLGGVGSRSRRCAGSVMAQVTDGSVSDFRFDVPRGVEDLQDQLSSGIKTAQMQMKQNFGDIQPPAVTQAFFDALMPQTCRIWILRNANQTWKTADDAMRAIGSSLQTYRSSLPLSNRTIFGLPLVNAGNGSRRASPLLLRAVELQGRTYAGIAVLFKTGNNQNYTLIENWVNRFSGKIEVGL